MHALDIYSNDQIRPRPKELKVHSTPVINPTLEDELDRYRHWVAELQTTNQLLSTRHQEDSNRITHLLEIKKALENKITILESELAEAQRDILMLVED